MWYFSKARSFSRENDQLNYFSVLFHSIFRSGSHKEVQVNDTSNGPVSKSWAWDNLEFLSVTIKDEDSMSISVIFQNCVAGLF